MMKDDFTETVSKLFDAAKKNLQRDKTLQLTFYFDCAKEPIYFQPEFNKKLDLSVIRNQVAHLLKDTAAKFYAFISEGHDPETKERMIIVQGFHRDGRFINLNVPFIENGGIIQFKSQQKSTDIKTADGIFSHMFSHVGNPNGNSMPDAYSLWEKGQDLLSQAKYEEAIAILQQALAIWPNDFKSIEHDVLWDLGRAYDELGRMEEAKEAYDKAGIIFYPIEEHWEKTAELKKSGKFSEALQELQKLKVLDPEDELIAQEIKKITNKIEKGPSK